MFLGLAAQAAVPGWMLLHRQLILSLGERVELPVFVSNPRDLLMGHYVRLWTHSDSAMLRGIPQNYLRYYCDQRYAKVVGTEGFGAPQAVLAVRVWRGAALAEELLLDGLPAEVYLAQACEGTLPTKPPERTRWRYAFPAVELPRVLCEGEGWEWTFAPHMDGVTHVRLPIHRAVLTRLLHLTLGDAQAAPLPPREDEALCGGMRRLKHGLDRSKRTGVLPFFRGLGFPCDLPLAQQAEAYYQALTHAFGLTPSDRIAFEGPASGPMVSPELLKPLFVRFPEARFFLHGNALPEGIAPEKAVLLPAPDSPPPKGIPWLASGEAPAPLPEGCLGSCAAWDPFPRLSSNREALKPLLARLKRGTDPTQNRYRETFIDAFAAHALACYAKTRNPEARRLADTLLGCAPGRTLWNIYQRCGTYQDYVEYVRWVAKHAPDPTLVPLAHWPEALRDLNAPPPPPRWRTPSKQDLVDLIQQVMALPTE